MIQWLGDVIEEIQSCKDLTAINSVLIKLKEHLGFSNICYVLKCSENFTQSGIIFTGDYPSDWADRYCGQGFVNIDPVAIHCFSSQLPYHWKHFNENVKGKVRDFFGEASEYKLCDGLSIGAHHFDGKASLISLSSEADLIRNSAQQLEATIYVNALEPIIYERVRQLYEESNHSGINVQLTKREKTCLLWVAEGKTANNIAAILTISEATVVFHLKNCIKKLNVLNRNQAIGKAIMLGLISPQFPLYSVNNYQF
jgi:DNA-binding CsgD family transcriptional regulator